MIHSTLATIMPAIFSPSHGPMPHGVQRIVQFLLLVGDSASFGRLHVGLLSDLAQHFVVVVVVVVVVVIDDDHCHRPEWCTAPREGLLGFGVAQL